MGRLAVILFGPPAAGKGTQARMVASTLGFPVISTGDILREAEKNRTALGIQAKGFMDGGALVPDSLVDAIVMERLQRRDCTDGFILDGYPRTLHQAEFIERSFRDERMKTLVIGIRVDDGILVSRIAGRRSCPECRKVFAAGSLRGQGEWKCDECGAPLIQRKDDTAEVMRERLQVYHRQTQPLIDYYLCRGCYFEVDGERPVDQVHGSILEIVNGQKSFQPASVS